MDREVLLGSDIMTINYPTDYLSKYYSFHQRFGAHKIRELAHSRHAQPKVFISLQN